MDLPIRRLIWSGLASLLSVGSLLACDTGPPSQVADSPVGSPAPTMAPADSPTSVPTPPQAPTVVLTATSVPASTPDPTPTSTVPVSESAPTEFLIAVSENPGDLPPYNRKDWRHWTDKDGDCQNTRHEVLVEESQAPVGYKDDRECQVLTGQWFGVFTGTTVTEASELDIDHFVPLKNAHLSGGWAWTPERKEEYANSLYNPDHLMAVTAGANRSKGAKGPDEWRPPNDSYWCDYAVAWIGVKQAWELTATQHEVDALKEMLGTCANPPELTAMEADPSAAPAGPTLSPTTAESYASCDEAEKAGVRRVQGAKGSGRGFPEAMVPSVRDGDADGVVCEK